MVSPVTGWGAAPQMAGGQPASLGSLNTPELGWGVRPESLQRKSKVGTGAEMSPGPGGPPPLLRLGTQVDTCAECLGGPRAPLSRDVGPCLPQSAGTAWALLHSAGGAEVRACSVAGAPATSPWAGSQ